LRLAENFQELFLRLDRLERLLADLLREVSKPPPEPDMAAWQELVRQAQEATAEASRRINAEWYGEHLARYHGKKVND